MSVDGIARQIGERAAASGFEGSVKLDLGADGVIVIDGGNVSTTDADADCTVRLSREDLEALVSGSLSPMEAFMAGRLNVEGDMNVAMGLARFL